MTKKKQDVTQYFGERKLVRFKVVDGDGNPKNMTTFTELWWGIWAKPIKGQAWEDALVTKRLSTADISLVDGDGTKDWAQFIVEPADIEDLSPTGYHHELKGQDGSAYPIVEAEGTYIIESSPTRDAPAP